MLVLSRRVDEKIFFPALGITLKVVRIKGNTVRLGIEAPPEIRVAREEVAHQEAAPCPAADIDQWQRAKGVTAKPDGHYAGDSVELPAKHRGACEYSFREEASASKSRPKSGATNTVCHNELQNRLNSANLAIHFAQLKLREGLTEEAWSALDDTVRCLESLEEAIGAAAELEFPPMSQSGLASVRERLGGYAVGRKTVLIVGPPKLDARSIAQYLESAGYRVVQLASDLLAIAYLARNVHPDVVLVSGESGEDFQPARLRIAESTQAQPSTSTIEFADESFTGWFANEAEESRILNTLATAG